MLNALKQVDACCRTKRSIRGACRALAAFAILWPAAAAWALDPNIFTDDNVNDVNISLREAIAGSSAGDTITLMAGTYNVTIAQININKSLTLVGQGQFSTSIAGDTDNRVFFIEDNVNGNDIVVEMLDLTIQDGTVTSGDAGGIRLGDGDSSSDSEPTLRMKRCTISNCQAADDGGGICIEDDVEEALFVDCTFSSNRAAGTGGDGGAVRVRDDEARFFKCTFNNNFAGQDGGAVFADAGLAIVRMTNCTLSGNRANRHGGAIGVDVVSFGSFVNCTITNNTCDANANDTGNGGGIRCTSLLLNTVFLKNTLVAGNTDDSADFNSVLGGGPTIHPDVSSSSVIGEPCLSSLGNNLIGKNNGASGDFPDGLPNANNDLVGTIDSPLDPMIGALGNNGGVTQTHALLFGSPAIDPSTGLLRGGVPGTCVDAGGTNPVVVDQRSLARPQGAKCDIGAFEYADCDGNNIDDMSEIANYGDKLRSTNPDANDNGVIDACEGLCCTTGQTELVLAADVSGSINDTELGEEIDGIKDCLANESLIPRNGTVKIAVVIYGATAHDLTGGLVTISDMSDIDGIGMDLMGLLSDRIVATNATNIGAALQLARSLLSAGGTENDHILLIGDGNSNTGPNVNLECFNVAADQIILCSIAVAANVSGQTELEDCAKATGGKFGIAPGMAGFPAICSMCLGEATTPCLTSGDRCELIGGTYSGDGSMNMAPILTCPQQEIECGDPLPGNPPVQDECPALVMFTKVEEAREGENCEVDKIVRTITRYWTAIDQCGETGTCTEIIVVKDRLPPMFTCPPDVMVPFGSPTDPGETGFPTDVVDACDPDPEVEHEDEIEDGACTEGFKINRRWTVTDDCGNANHCVQMIQVKPPERGQFHAKADLFFWPFVRVRWDNKNTPNPLDDEVDEDTFIALSNDDTKQHWVKLIFVDGVNWRIQDRVVRLTPKQPLYFSAFTGRGGSSAPIAPYKDLRPEGYDSFPDDMGIDNLRVVEGFIVGWTVDANNRPEGTNQISSNATVVCYDQEAVWDYKPWGFRSFFTGIKPDTTRLRLNGLPGEYQATPCCLLVDFYAAGTGALCPHPNSTCVQDFELSLLPAMMDFRQMPDQDMDGTRGELPVVGGEVGDSEPPITAVSVLSWNEAESPVSNSKRCVTCWDSTLASDYGFMGAASPFAYTTLQTAKGKATLCGGAAAACDRPASSPWSQTLTYGKRSKNMPILGVAHKIITWSPSDGVEKTESALVGIGDRTDGFIVFDATHQGTSPTLGAPSASGALDASPRGDGTGAAPTRRR